MYRCLPVFQFVVISIFANWLAAQSPTPAPRQSKPLLLKGATIHTVTGETLEKGEMLFVDGKIAAIGQSVERPPNVDERLLEGLQIYPGMIEAYSQIGLTEISSIPATLDHAETGVINPNVHAQVAINPDSEIVPVTRAGGVLLALSAPTGGLVSGRSTVIQLDGWTSEDMTLLENAALHLNWPSSFRPARRRPNPNDDSGNPVQRIQELRELFRQAREYLALRTSASAGQKMDLKLESLADVVSGKVPLMVRADQANDIESAVAFAAEQKVKLVILGGYDAPHCAGLLKKYDVPVIVSAVYRLPLRRNDPDDHAYTLPARLLESGVRFCISSSDRSETWNTRNLPFHAGTAAAFGLPVDEALKAITIYPARILNIADRVGSLEVGKDATVIVTTGSPLDTRSQIKAAYIQGRPVDLSSRQTRLYEKYRQKYERPSSIERD